MQATLTFYSTEGPVCSFDFDTEQDNISKTLELDSAVIDININRTTPLVIKFRTDKGVRLNRICLYVSLDPLGQEILYYDAGTCTNAFAGIRKYDIDRERFFWSRDIFMAKGNGKVLNIAFATFRRFFTKFCFENRKVAAEYFMEDKAVLPDTDYELEHILVDDKQEALEFFEGYTEYLSKIHKIPEFKYIPCGWSSWSCFYGAVDEKKTLHEAKQLKEKIDSAKLIQIDDGWQREGSFGAYWTENFSRFPSGMKGVRDELKEMGYDFGIWMAPGFVKDKSTRFEELYDLLVKEADGSIVKCFGGGESLIADKDGSVYALDIGKEEVTELAREMFTRGVNEYGAIYFKVDFITNLIYRAGNGNIPVVYDSGYSVELYQRYMDMIRKTVGDDIFLLACGAPIGESAGVFDSIRISPDITWGGAGKNGLPTAFEIIRNDIQNVILRSPYHKKVFINDPDALILRDYFSSYSADGLNMSYDEARLWATVVAMSGGHILLNEETDRLTPERLELANSIMPPLGVAARPRDFFEYPYCTEAYIPFVNNKPYEEAFYTKEKLKENGAVLCAVFNVEEEEKEKTIDLTDYFDHDTISGYEFIAINTWTHEHAVINGGKINLNLRPHSCEAFLIRPLIEGFLYCDSSFYSGMDQRIHGNYFFYSNEQGIVGRYNG